MNSGYQVVTIAGSRKEGSENGYSSESTFNYPSGLCRTSDGLFYIADRSNHIIRMICNNEVTTIAGTGKYGFYDGFANEAMFAYPTSLCCSDDGKIYVADPENHRVRLVYNGLVTTMAGTGEIGSKDGKANKAKFAHPTAICMSNDGRIYVSDMITSTIRMIYNSKVTTIAGTGKEGFKDGKALKSMFNRCMGISCSIDGRLYVTDLHNHVIRMIYDGKVTTIAGNGNKGFKDGNALEAMFANPTGIYCSNDGRIYLTDTENSKVRMIYNGQVTTIAGNGKAGFQDGNALEAMFGRPHDLILSNDGRIYITDSNNNRIRMLYNN